MKLAAIDFETANYSPISMCAAGLALFEEGELTESHHWLIRPPTGYGRFRDDFSEIHGLTHRDVCKAPSFGDIAPVFLHKMLAADLVVAHNAGFDMRVLHATLEHYGVDIPPFRYECTLQLARAAWPQLLRHSLETVAEHFGLTFKHHDAREDAEMAGRLFFNTRQSIA